MLGVQKEVRKDLGDYRQLNEGLKAGCYDGFLRTFELVLTNDYECAKCEKKAKKHFRQVSITVNREGLAVNETADIMFFPYYDKTRVLFWINKRNHQNENILTENAEKYIILIIFRIFNFTKGLSKQEIQTVI